MKTKLTLLILLLFTGLNVFAQQTNHSPTFYFLLNGSYFDPYVYTINNTQVSNTIELFPGDTMRIVVPTSDRDQGDSVTVSSNITTIIPGATFSVNSAQHQTATLLWVPTLADVGLEPKAFEVKISEVTTHPIKNISNEGFEVRVNLPGSITRNNNPIDLTHIIDLRPGEPFNLRMSSLNPASNDSIRISSNLNTVIPAATFSTNTAKHQTADISWIPTPADMSAIPYIFNVTLQDNSVPGGKQYNYIVKLRVGNLMAVKKELSLGTFTAYPNPFSDELRFSLDLKAKAESILIYNLVGQQVDRISLQNLEAGKQLIPWEKASRLPKGTYLARLICEDKAVQVLKFTRQ